MGMVSPTVSRVAFLSVRTFVHSMRAADRLTFLHFLVPAARAEYRHESGEYVV